MARPTKLRPSALAIAVLVGLSLLGPAGEGGGAAPVLVLTDSASANPFGNYLGEILRGEGLNAFDEMDRQAWSPAAGSPLALDQYRAVLLAEMYLSPTDQQALRQFVQDGGVLLAARPDAGLADLFGVEFAGNRPERLLQYFSVDPAAPAGQGVTPGALQYHGVASNYTLREATGLAWLLAGDWPPTANPAVTTHRYGAGRAIAFSFDPARSVVLTRQGNPAWQNSEGDGIPEYRPHDLFVRTDGRSYYDADRLNIPHADELQRLVANVLQGAVGAPLPRMWYLPGTHTSLMVNTGDGEDNYGAQFDAVLADAAGYGGKFSVYLRDIGVANTSVAKETAWRAAGHEVGVHMYAQGAEGAGAGPQIAAAYGRLTGNLEAKFGHQARSARNHTIDWTGWVDMASIEGQFGTLLDANYYHYLNSSAVDPQAANGYFTGSGLPQRFIDEQGNLLGVYQAATQWPDEWFANNGMSAQQAVAIMKAMFEAAESDGYYSAFVNNIHPVRYNGPDITSDWAHAIWQYCQEEGIPMWSAEMLLDFVQARNATQFDNLVYAANGVEFDYVAGGSRHDLTVMLPTAWDDQRLATVSADGESLEWSVRSIKGVEYAMLTPGVHSARISAQYAPLPTADFDDDGDVDADDLAAWQAGFGAGASADADLDFDSDGADFLAWQRQFTAPRPPPPAVAAPEPPPLASLAAVAVAVLLERRSSPRRQRLRPSRPPASPNARRPRCNDATY